MNKSRNKIIIKTRKGGFTKLYANGKWQHRVTNLDFYARVDGHKIPYINIICEFDTLVCSKGIPVVENNEFVHKHHIVRV